MPVADDELRRALETVLRRPVRALARRPHPYGSSHAIEDVELTFEDGSALALVFKDTTAPRVAAGAGKPAWLLDPDREAQAYVDVVGPARLGLPQCYGAFAAPGRRWLFLESVDGIPLWQTQGTEAWDAAARWLAALHARGAPAGGGRHLLRYDAAYLHGWLARARALTPPGALDGVAAVWERVVERLVAWPPSVVHGDFHPSNVLVEDAAGTPRIRPVDWDLAGVGPGLLDLAALCSGSWSAAERERIALAYYAALGPARSLPTRADLLEALAHGRLFCAVQWLGWSRGWSPPAEHAHDWLAEATGLAEELAT